MSRKVIFGTIGVFGLYALVTLPEWARGQSHYVFAALFLLFVAAALVGVVGVYLEFEKRDSE